MSAPATAHQVQLPQGQARQIVRPDDVQIRRSLDTRQDHVKNLLIRREARVSSNRFAAEPADVTAFGELA